MIVHGDFLSAWSSRVASRLATEARQVLVRAADTGADPEAIMRLMQQKFDYVLIDEGQKLIRGGRPAAVARPKAIESDDFSTPSCLCMACPSIERLAVGYSWICPECSRIWTVIRSGRYDSTTHLFVDDPTSPNRCWSTTDGSVAG